MLADYIEQLYDTFRDAVCVTDARGVVVLVNRRHSELTGIPKEDILGKRVQDMVQNGIFDVVLNAKVVNSGEKVASVQHLYNGRILILDGYPIKNDAGEVVYVVTIIRDITVLSELREEVTAQKELLETFQALNSDAAVPDAIQYPRVLQSQAMQRLYGEAANIARTDATVLLLGETGTGKDVMARHIHHLSGRADAPFIKVDCGSIPENLIETELFGYVPGSFSGASKNGKAGLVEAANGGTLFLDEVGELPMPMQTRLLRVLQDWEVLRVGATVPRKVDVRVIAATNKDLEKELERGSFRSDLYYRLKVAVLTLPPPAQAQGGHPALGTGLPHLLRQALPQEGAPLRRGGAHPARLCLAGQCARAGKPHPGPARHLQGRLYPGRGPRRHPPGSAGAGQRARALPPAGHRGSFAQEHHEGSGGPGARGGASALRQHRRTGPAFRDGQEHHLPQGARPRRRQAGAQGPQKAGKERRR